MMLSEINNPKELESLWCDIHLVLTLDVYV